MRQKYQELEVEILELQEDIITTSTVKDDMVWEENPWEE